MGTKSIAHGNLFLSLIFSFDFFFFVHSKINLTLTIH